MQATPWLCRVLLASVALVAVIAAQEAGDKAVLLAYKADGYLQYGMEYGLRVPYNVAFPHSPPPPPRRKAKEKEKKAHVLHCYYRNFLLVVLEAVVV